MNIVIIALIVVGLLAATAGQVIFLIAAFRVHVGWGLALLFCLPFAHLAFMITHWEEAKLGFQIQILGVLVGLAGVYLGAGSTMAGLTDRLPGGDAEEDVTSEEGDSWFPTFPFEAETNAPPTLSEDPPEAQSALIGLTEVEVRRAMGNPSSEFRSKGVTTWFYGEQEISFKDGIVIEAN